MQQNRYNASIRQCKQCHQPFTFGRWDHVYCSPRCRKRAQRAKNPVTPRPLPRCSYCHQNAVADIRARYCCHACKQAAYRLRKRAGAQKTL